MRETLISIIVLLSIIAFWFYASTVAFYSYEEDAFISFRYSKTLAGGGGLSFNGLYGGNEKVAGYSNFLWVMILALMAKLGANIVIASRVILLLVGACNIILLFILSRKISGKDTPVNYIASLLLVGNIPYLWYGAGGLETSIFIALSLSSLILFIREEKTPGKYLPLSAIMCFLLSMTHPEGPIYFLALIIVRFIIRKRDGGWANYDWRWFFTFSGLYASFLLFNIGYFKDPLPVSFFAKSAGHPSRPISGVMYLFNFILDAKMYLLLLPTTVFIFLRDKKMLNIPLLGTAFLSAAGILFVLVSGGDSKSNYRFIIPFLPFVFLLIQEGVRRFVELLKEINSVLYVGALTLIVIILLLVNSVLYKDFVPGGNLLTLNARNSVTEKNYFAK